MSEWSKKLRKRFRLEKYFEGFVVSGDAGARKPAPAIYHKLLELMQENPKNITFVDDNAKNLDSAAALGFHTILFRPMGDNVTGCVHQTVRNFGELELLLP